jgi:voltage-gated potassium channel Kch
MSETLHSESNLKTYLRQTFTDPLCPRFQLWHNLINFFIFLSCASLALETVEDYSQSYTIIFDIIEFTSVAFFTVDYLQSWYFSPNRARYLVSFWGIVDLLSILPSYLMIINLTALQGTKVFRLLRVLRVLRVLKLAREAMRQISSVEGEQANPLVVNLRIYFIALFSVLMISSTLMFYVEGNLYTSDAIAHGQQLLDAQAASMGKEAEKFVPFDPITGTAIPEDKRFFTSIPTAMWWCIVTLTTTGYGDLYPVTVGGRIIAGVTMLLGLVLFGILMNIVGKTLMIVLFGESATNENIPSVTTGLEAAIINSGSRKIAALLILAEEGYLDKERVIELSNRDPADLRDALSKI